MDRFALKGRRNAIGLPQHFTRYLHVFWLRCELCYRSPKCSDKAETDITMQTKMRPDEDYVFDGGIFVQYTFISVLPVFFVFGLELFCSVFFCVCPTIRRAGFERPFSLFPSPIKSVAPARRSLACRPLIPATPPG